MRRNLEAIRAGGRIGWFWRWLGVARAEGRIGWFWRGLSLLEVACDRLAIDLQLASDSTLRPASAIQGRNCVYDGHFEVIRHGATPEKEGFSEGYLSNSRLLLSGWFSSAPWWLVFSAR